MGLLRLLTNPRIIQTNTPTTTIAWKILDELREARGVAFAHEPATLASTWREISQEGASGPNSWTDSYLLAFAEGAGYTLVTFDRALSRRNGSVRLLT
jgi:predicted nucleic acid-binding protein